MPRIEKVDMAKVAVLIPKWIVEKIDAEARPKRGLVTDRSHIIQKILYERYAETSQLKK